MLKHADAVNRKNKAAIGHADARFVWLIQIIGRAIYLDQLFAVQFLLPQSEFQG